MPHRPLSVLSHVELLTPDLDASVAFARDILGLDVVAEEGDSVYLRCWGDYLRATASCSPPPAEPGLGHAAWRTWNAEQLDDRRRFGRGRRRDQGEWIGVLLRPRPRVPLHGPGRPPEELFWDVERAVAPPARSRRIPSARSARSPRHRRAHPRPRHRHRADVKAAAFWHHDVLDFRIMGGVEGEPGAPWFFGLVSCNEKSHDLGFILDCDGTPGRLHHVAFWVETNHDLTRGAKFLVEHGHDIDFGPGEHGIGEQNYLYFRDPVGLRYELNSGGYRNYVPDWEPAIWRFEDGPNNSYRTEIGMPAVHMAEIPPGIVGRHEEMVQGIVAKG